MPDSFDAEPGTASVHSHLGAGPRRPRRDASDAEEPLVDAAGLLGSARERAERFLSSAADAIEERTGIVGLARDNPVAAMGVAFAVGYLVGGAGDGRGRMGRAKQQLRGAVFGALTAAVAQAARDLSDGEEGGLLAGLLSQMMEPEEPAPRTRRR